LLRGNGPFGLVGTKGEHLPAAPDAPSMLRRRNDIAGAGNDRAMANKPLFRGTNRTDRAMPLAQARHARRQLVSHVQHL
jgi:hypothetical protein